MVKKVRGYRLSDRTIAQLETITEASGMSRTEALSLAIDKLYQEIIKESGTDAGKTGDGRHERDSTLEV